MAEIIEVNRSQVPADFLAVVLDILAVRPEMYDVRYFLYDGTPTAVLVEHDADGNAVSFKPLGCPLCIRPRISRDAAGRMLISGRPAIPLSAVGDPDVRDPLRSVVAFCPDCGCTVFDPRATRAPLPGETRGFRDG